jgi:hypothetical protein
VPKESEKIEEWAKALGLSKAEAQLLLDTACIDRDPNDQRFRQIVNRLVAKIDKLEADNAKLKGKSK